MLRNGQDLGATAPGPWLPPDVRMPHRRYEVSEFTGSLIKVPEKELCHIDTPEGELGVSPDADVYDQSRHGGVLHAFTAQPHAKSNPGEDPRLHVDQLAYLDRQWVRVPGGRGPDAYRLIDIEGITLPHDCANHLPE